MAVKEVTITKEQVTCDVDNCDSEAIHTSLMIDERPLDLCEKHRKAIGGSTPVRGAKTAKVTDDEKQNRIAAYNKAHADKPAQRYTAKIEEWWNANA